MKSGRRGSGPAAATRRSSGSRAVIALVVMAGLVLLYGWNNFFLAPKAEAKAKLHKQLAAARQQEADLRRNLAELRKLANDTQAREAELARLGRLIPADADIAGAILTLNETAHQARVAWSSFVPSPPTPATGGPMSIGISMRVSGTFQQIFDYLRRLEQLDRLVVVDSLQLSPGAEGSAGTGIQASINARMFSAGKAGPAAATAAAAGNTPNSSGTAALPKAGG
ncbi:MAG: type 4a pilus biogenesis protein PilO [Actinomycetota bacterium]